MSTDLIQRLEALLSSDKETLMLRYSLAKSYFDGGNFRVARTHLGRAVELDLQYQEAWNWLGKASLELGDPVAARQAWSTGLECAHAKGDAQVYKELEVFLRRIDKVSK